MQAAAEALPDRSRSLIAVGVLEVLMGLAMTAMGVLSLRVGGATGLWQLLYGAAGTAAGVGSILRAEWGRRASLAVASLTLVFGALGIALAGFVLRADATVSIGAVVALICILLAVPAALAVFYSRRSVRQTCLAHSGASEPAPVLVYVLAGWMAFSAISSLSGLGTAVMAPFGAVVRGPPAIALTVVNGLAAAALAWGLWRRSRRAWIGAMVFQSLWLLSALVALRRDALGLWQEMGIAANISGVMPLDQLARVTTTAGIALAVFSVAVFLAGRKHFTR